MSGVVLLFAAIAAGCAILAKLGFRGREHVVGIDLGTTYSVIGVKQHENVTIITDSTTGRVLFPSVVSFLSGGQILVGQDAKKNMVNDPVHTIYNAKRFIGENFTNPAVQVEAEAYDYQIAEQYNTDINESEICFRIQLEGHPDCVSPVVVGQLVVQSLLQVAYKFLGHNLIYSAVIAVPADFNAERRKATARAFNLAGLRVIRILEEPTAAAIAYGLHKDPNINYVLVYDFGGGTLDVSLLYIRKESIVVIGTAGNNHLGGSDFDQVLGDHLEVEFEKLLGETLPSIDEGSSNGEYYPCTISGARAIAEQVKLDLSTQMETKATCELRHNTASTKSGSLISITITREQFETVCLDLLNDSMNPIHQVLEDNDMTTDMVDEVVLVGGSSRIPWVRHAIKQLFGGREPHHNIDPDVAVAWGAARLMD